jgi:uncharacterized protein
MFRKAVGGIDWLCAQVISILITGYRHFISPILGCNCRFYPSCSEYAQTAIETYGAWKGIGLALKRISKCHPWHHGGYDPVPAKIRSLKIEKIEK